MANTYTLISSNTLTGTTGSVTFSSIPSTYTDLVLKMSLRTNATANTYDTLFIEFNNEGSGGSNNSYTRIIGDGATATSSRGANDAQLNIYRGLDTNGATANTFSSIDIYFPSYTASQNKPSSIFAAHETNATTAYLTNTAGLWRNTAAISTIYLYGNNSFVSGSTFYLYGIKNS